MNNLIKRIISTVTTAVLICGTGTSAGICSSASAKTEDAVYTFEMDTSVNYLSKYESLGRLYNQWDKKWKTPVYKGGGTIYSSGCMLFSFANAIYCLNKNKVDIKDLADWSYKNGSWKPSNGGGYREPFYNKVENSYGNKYNFKIKGKYYGKVNDSRLINHLKDGGVAAAHVPGHFIAIVGYNSGNKKYHVIESAVSSGRGLSASGWYTASKLSSGNSKVDWFVLISNKSSAPGNEYFPKYTGKSNSLVDALNSLGIDSSAAYRTKIANANGITPYNKTAAQNTKMLNLLKAGKLINPDSAPGKTPAVTYFKRYTGSSISIVTALNTIGEDSSFAYRKKIAAANGISNYSGTAAQNINMVNLLKSGKLIKP